MDSIISFTRRIIPPTETNFYIPSTWMLEGAVVDLDFQNGRYWNDPNFVDVATLLSISRASIGYTPTQSGTLTQFAENTLRITDLGLHVEDARTNVVLWNRDLTNAAWTPTNMTAAKDQTGPDGVANSASSILATAGNATILQSITLALSVRVQSAYVKRITGTGTVEMTMDNGSTWTAITVTANWSLVSIPVQTITDPIVGFRIVTSGDKIAIDFVQNENGITTLSPASSPIPTTTVAVTRAADVVQCIGSIDTYLAATTASLVANGTDYWDGNGNYKKYLTGGISGLLTTIQAPPNKVFLRASSGDLTLNADFGNGMLMSTGAKYGGAWSPSGRSVVAGGGTVSTDAQTVDGIDNCYVGYGHGNVNEATFGYFRRITVWNSRLADATLRTFTAP